MKSIEDFKLYLDSCIGSPYWPNTYGQKASTNLEKKLKNEFYGWSVTNSSSDYGKRVYDSAGLIKGFLWSTDEGTPAYKSSEDISPYGFYLLSKHGKADTFPKTNGTYLYKSITKNSIGIYQMGVYFDGYVYQSEKNKGVTCTLYRVQDWPFWSVCNFLK